MKGYAMIKRSEFIGSAVAAGAVAVIGAPALASTAKLAESTRFPGFVLKAFADVEEPTEIYLAFSAQALADQFTEPKFGWEHTAEEYEELDPSDIITNAKGEARKQCDGRCGARGDDHECFVIGDKIKETLAVIDSGEMEASWEKCNAETRAYREQNRAALLAENPEFFGKDLYNSGRSTTSVITVVRNRSKSNGIRRFNVGRPTVLGNPFRVEEHGVDVAVTKFREYLDRVVSDPKTSTERNMVRVLELLVGYAREGDIELGCCGRDVCHAYPIKDYIEARLAA